MTEHEKVYVVCENLCMEEGMTKEQSYEAFETKVEANALQNQINNLASGSPKGVYETTSALVSANPDSGVYVVSADGHIYSWTKNGSNAIDLGVYQAEINPDVEAMKTGYNNRIYGSANEAIKSQITDLHDAINTRVASKSRNYLDSVRANGMAFEELFPNSNKVKFNIGPSIIVPNNTDVTARIYLTDGTRIKHGLWYALDNDGNEIVTGSISGSIRNLAANAEKIRQIAFYIGTADRANYQGNTIERVYFGEFKEGDGVYDDYYVNLEDDLDYTLNLKDNYLKNSSNYPFEDYIKPQDGLSFTNMKIIIDMFVDLQMRVETTNPVGYYIDLIEMTNSALSTKQVRVRISKFVDKNIEHVAEAISVKGTDFSQELITLDIKDITTNNVIGKMILRTKNLTSDFTIDNLEFDTTALSVKCFANDFKLNSTVITNKGIEKVFDLPFENDTFAFGILTDTHYTNAKDIENCVKSQVEVVNKTPVDALVCLGDNVPGNLTKKRTLTQMRYITGLMAQTRKDFYCIKGNHDVNDWQFDPATMDANEWLTTENDIIKNMISLSHSKNTIKHCSTNKTFYYVDYEDKKVRCIFLNTSERVGDQTIWGVRTEEQKNWVKNVALNFMDKTDRSGWKAIVFCHIIPVVEEFTHNYGFARPGFHKMLLAFKNGTASNESGYECDFIEQGPIKLAGVFGGHVHDDCYGKVDGINYVVSNCTSTLKKYDSSPMRTHYQLRDISNNVFMCDFTANKIYKVKVGSGNDAIWDM